MLNKYHKRTIFRGHVSKILGPRQKYPSRAFVLWYYFAFVVKNFIKRFVVCLMVLIFVGYTIHKQN